MSERTRDICMSNRMPNKTWERVCKYVSVGGGNSKWSNIYLYIYTQHNYAYIKHIHIICFEPHLQGLVRFTPQGLAATVLNWRSGQKSPASKPCLAHWIVTPLHLVRGKKGMTRNNSEWLTKYLRISKTNTQWGSMGWSQTQNCFSSSIILCVLLALWNRGKCICNTFPLCNKITQGQSRQPCWCSNRSYWWPMKHWRSWLSDNDSSSKSKRKAHLPRS